MSLLSIDWEIQKYARATKSHDPSYDVVFDNRNYKHNSELTVTFNRTFYNRGNAALQCSVIIKKLARQLVTTKSNFILEACMEYHDDLFPHLHIGVYSGHFLQNEKGNLWQIISKMCSGYGRTHIYHQEEPFYHVFDKDKRAKYGVDGMYWSDYIRKNVAVNGSSHYIRGNFMYFEKVKKPRKKTFKWEVDLD